MLGSGAVAGSNRSLDLLRATGATPGQIRRMVYSEALLVAVVASAAGALAGPALGRRLLPWAAPSWITAPSDHSWPGWTAFGTGTAVALLGAVAAAWRAGRMRPGEALHDAAVEDRAMPLTRRLLGIVVLLGALAMMAATAIGDPGSATNRKTYMPVVMLLVAGAGLLAPALVRPVARLLTAPLSRLRGAAALVASTSATASARRTAAIAAPVLVTVGLAASLLMPATFTPSSLAALLAGHDARIATAPAAEPGNSASRTGLLVVLAIVLGYTTLALVNTLLMAAPDRAGEHRTLRLLGATAPQVLRATTLEVLVAFAVGVVLAVLCLAATVIGLWLALLRLAGPLPITFPWPIVGAVTAGTALLAVLTAATATRGRPATNGRPAGCR
ncbi:FtsX-like permease family protein [Dactylosporangium darangshiense]|uniref:ABC3 transporter permease C-terminal domain-containing protein n=1 Tax=Dactylosporangium darangshiense TaxID=579108 RepID=A0ABP8DLY7_9ACTN